MTQPTVHLACGECGRPGGPHRRCVWPPIWSCRGAFAIRAAAIRAPLPSRYPDFRLVRLLPGGEDRRPMLALPRLAVAHRRRVVTADGRADAPIQRRTEAERPCPDHVHCGPEHRV